MNNSENTHQSDEQSDQNCDERLEQRVEVLYGDRVNGTLEVSGIVHVIRSESELPFVREGEILVAARIDAQWSEQLSLAKALIEDATAEGSTVANIASCYDLPAIANVVDAMDELRSGDIVTISAMGEIHRLPEQRAPDSPMRVSVPAVVDARSGNRIITAANVVAFSAAKKNREESDASTDADIDDRSEFKNPDSDNSAN